MNLSGIKATVASPDPEEVLKEVSASLEREPRVRARQYPIQIVFNDADDTVTLLEVGSVSDA